MTRGTLAAAAVGFVLLVAGSIAAQNDKSQRAVRKLSVRDIVEKLDGKKTKVTTVEVTIGPGDMGKPHRHPGPVFGYVLEGTYEWAINDNPAQRLKVGDTFYEPAGSLHRVSSNPSKTARARILAVMLHDANVTDLVLPATTK